MPGRRTGPRGGNPQARPDVSYGTDTARVTPAVERLREALEEHDCQPRGSMARFRARCPVHGSHGPTLAVSQGHTGAVLKCHAQCETADVLAALGLSWDDMFDQPRGIRSDWLPRPRRAIGPEQAARVIVRAIGIEMLRDALPGMVPLVPRMSTAERVEHAEWGCRQDAGAHYWRTLARYAALACDEGYVRRAYADLAAWRADQALPKATRRKVPRPTHEQIVVLMTRAEDLERARESRAG